MNGRVAELGVKVSQHDDIRLDGRPIRTRAAAAAQVFIFNRSAGDPLRDTDVQHDSPRTPLIDRLPTSAGRRFIAVSPMPGIDGGLELVTSDGALATKLQRAIHRQVIRVHRARQRVVRTRPARGSRVGQARPCHVPIEVESVKTSEADLEGSNRWYSIVVRGASGKDVRQLFERQGALVSRTQRVAVGSLKLDKSLARGQLPSAHGRRGEGVAETRGAAGDDESDES